MSRLSVELQGEQGFRKALAQAAQDVKDAAEAVVVATAIELRADIVTSIQRGPASGRVYEKYNPRRTHKASAPGQPPMSDTGRLANNIYFERLGDLTAAVGSTLIYAVYLEYGTSTMNFARGVGGPRPFFRPAIEKMRPKFRDKLEVALSGALR